MTALLEHLFVVDWNNDGDYVDTGEDVTARVRGNRGFSATRGRDQIRELAPPMAGFSSKRLDNTSRDYSPENASSPLAGNLVPGRSMRALATRHNDTFDRADDAAALGTPDVGNAYTVASGTWGISANKAYNVTDTDGNTVYTDVGTPDAVMQATIRGTLNHATIYRVPLLMFRRGDANNHLRVELRNGAVDLKKMDGGVVSTLATAAQTTADDTDYTVRVLLEGNVIHVAVDGTLRITHTLSGGDTKYAGSTYTGFGMRLLKSGAPAVAARWDNLRVYTAIATTRLDGLPQVPDRGKRYVEVTGLGTLSRLRGQRASTALYQNITTDVALGHVLNAIGMTDTALRSFETGKTTLLWWWLDDDDAFDALAELLATEGPGAAIFEDGRGRIVFQNRHHRVTNSRSTSSQGTFSDTGSEPLFITPFHYDPGLHNIINECVVDVTTRSAKATSVVWTLGQTVALAPNESRKYIARNDAPFTAAITPASGTDYTVSAGSLSSVSLDRTSGQSVTVTLTAGASGATVTGLQLRAQLVSTDYTTRIANTIDTSTSKGKYGTRTFTFDTRQEIAVNEAQDFANAIVRAYQEPRATITFAISATTKERADQAMQREISDRVTVVEAQTGLNDAAYIDQVRHIARQAGGLHHAVFGCEKVVDESTYAVWGTTVWSNAAGTTPGAGVWAY